MVWLYSQPKIYPVHHVVCELKCLYWFIVFEAGWQCCIHGVCVSSSMQSTHIPRLIFCDFSTISVTFLPLIHLDGEDSYKCLSGIPAFSWNQLGDVLAFSLQEQGWALQKGIYVFPADTWVHMLLDLILAGKSLKIAPLSEVTRWIHLVEISWVLLNFFI